MNPYDVDPILKRIVTGAQGVSDILFSPGNVPKVVQNGTLSNAPLKDLKSLNAYQTEIFANALLRDKEPRERFQKLGIVMFSYSISKFGYFRVSLMRQVSGISINLRCIPAHPHPIEALGLNKSITRHLDYQEGLILCCSSTGNGRSATMASLIHQLIQVKPAHVVTVETPVEFRYTTGQGLVQQLEVPNDVAAMVRGIRMAVSQGCHVIACTHLNHPDLLKAALEASVSGHLVLGTLAASSMESAMSRLFKYLPEEGERKRLARELRCMTAQRLLPRRDGKGRVGVFEVLNGSDRLQAYVGSGGQDGDLKTLFHNDASDNQSLQANLTRLLQTGVISQETARRYAGDTGPEPVRESRTVNTSNRVLELDDDSIALEIATD